MIDKAELGINGPQIGRMGYGAMVLEGYYGSYDDRLAVESLTHAIDMGMMIDTADAYGDGHNESLVSKALKAARNGAFIATKFGIVFDEKETGTEIPTGWGYSLNINTSPEYTQRALIASLKRLGVETIDLWYAHYLDRSTPVEETIGVMADAVRAGKVRYIGLSNVTSDEIRRAHAIHPISAVQYEYSLWRREAEIDLLPTLRELGVALVCWSPLGGGFLTGTVKELSEGDFRNFNPRYKGDNFRANQERFAPLLDVSHELNISPAQLALSWLLHQGKDIFPIPGSRKIDRINENAKAIDIALYPEVLDRINKIAEIGITKGNTLL
jgi:aryl-alcohol dehydrogenase-like predicted oxidoreductase